MEVTINQYTLIHQAFELLLSKKDSLTKKKEILQAQAVVLNMHIVPGEIMDIVKEALSEIISKCVEHKAKMSSMHIIGKETLNEFYTFKINQAQTLIGEL